MCAQVLCKDAKPTKHTQTLILRKARGIVRFLEGLVRGEGWCGNSSGSRPNFFGRQHLTFDKGGKGVGDFRGIIVFLQLLWEWQYSVQREEQARQGCLSVCAQVLCKDAKPTKHTQTLILRKARGIVRFLEGLVRGEGWCGNSSGSRPNFFGRQHLTFDKGR